jgi:hypothetical protein
MQITVIQIVFFIVEIFRRKLFPIQRQKAIVLQVKIAGGILPSPHEGAGRGGRERVILAEIRDDHAFSIVIEPRYFTGDRRPTMTPAPWRRLPTACIADFQSAERPTGLWTNARSAGWKPAIKQTGSLRYDTRGIEI